MRRKLAFLEASLYAEGEVSNHAVATIKISGLLFEDNLRLALDKVQRRHPLLQTYIQKDEKGYS